MRLNPNADPCNLNMQRTQEQLSKLREQLLAATKLDDDSSEYFRILREYHELFRRYAKAFFPPLD